jgi:glycosyltransferase involved in cell wall biosynthesis
MLVSIVIRTLNEERYLPKLLAKLKSQVLNDTLIQIIVIDSGSTDATIDIAKRYGCVLLNIKKQEFTFGRSLNQGCESAAGNILVFISGHCVPEHNYWLSNLISPLINKSVSYAYGKQNGGKDSRFSESQIFSKYFPAVDKIPQEGFYCNNANAAILRDVWVKYGFDEELTGLEDMDMAKRLTEDGLLVGYVSDAPVFHYHSESWGQVRKRFERESIALQKIMPQVHINFFDIFRYILVGVFMDFLDAFRRGIFWQSCYSIIMYRLNQYIGTYLGNHRHRIISQLDKEKYFYPK